MKKIAIICAAPHFEFNPGMHSVDLAAFSFFQRHTFSEDIDLHFYLIHEPEPRLKAFLEEQLPFKYELFLNQLDQLYQSDLIIYWGDFLHNAPYHRGVARRLQAYQLAKSQSEAFSIIEKHLFLSDAPLEVLQKTVVFGSNFFINGSEDLLNESFQKNITRFFSQIQKVWTRDILSAVRMSHVRKDYQTNYTGIDCSFLFDKGTKKQSSEKKQTLFNALFTSKQKVKGGVFLGRMHESFPQLFPFVREIQQQLQADLEWIPWFWQNEEFYTSMRENLPRVKFLPEQKNLMELYELLKTFDFIVTDTYHLCLNAWKMGIPAICIGSGNSLIDSTLTDKKKELFFYMYEAQEFYVFLDEIKDEESRTKRINRLSKYITNEKVTETIRQNLLEHKTTIEKQLRELVASVCDKA